MREHPTGAELLDIARQVLLRDLLPLLPASSRYPALMTANAMAVAARDARRDPAMEQALEHRAWALLGGETPGEVWSVLAAAIRSGRFDPGSPGHDEARLLLHDYAVVRCVVSNPRRLDEERSREKPPR